MERRCDPCQGVGVVESPRWRSWIEAEAEVLEAASTQEGYDYLAVKARFLQENAYPVEPEEMTCGECEGLGWQLTPEGVAFFQFLRRHGR